MMLALLSSSGAPGSRGQTSLSLLYAQCLPSKLCVEAHVNDAASAVTTVSRIVVLAPGCQEFVSVGGGSAGSNKLPSADSGITVSAPMIKAATRKRPAITGVGSSSSTRRATVLVPALLTGAVAPGLRLTSGLLGSLVAIARFNSALPRGSQALLEGVRESLAEKPAWPSLAVGKGAAKQGFPEDLMAFRAEVQAVPEGRQNTLTEHFGVPAR